MLTAYPWPGNVRELQSVIDRAAILGKGQRLNIATALGMPTGATGSASPSAPTPNHQPPTPPSSTLVTLDEVARQHIERVLTSTGGKIEGPAGAAKVLGINPHTLRARMRKLKLDWSKFRSPV